MKQTKSIRNGKDFYETQFNSIHEFLHYITTTETNEIFGGKEKDIKYLSSHQGTEQFTKTKSFEEAKSLLKNGWDYQAKELEQKLKLKDLKPKTKQRAQYDVIGFQASVPRYLQGIPTSMINKKNIVQKQKVITLNKSISYHAGIEAEEIIENSLKALQIVQAIEAEGIRVNLNIIWGIKNTSIMSADEINVVKIRIKSAGERLNVSKVAFPLVHPSMLRRLSFRLMEVGKTFTKKSYTIGYGQPLQDEQTNEREYLEFKDEYLLPRFIKDVNETVENILK